MKCTFERVLFSFKAPVHYSESAPGRDHSAQMAQGTKQKKTRQKKSRKTKRTWNNRQDHQHTKMAITHFYCTCTPVAAGCRSLNGQAEEEAPTHERSPPHSGRAAGFT